jgi:predicted site-specific integrase-resolvase
MHDVYASVLVMRIHDMQMLTPAETMASLAISRRTLDRYVERGELQPARLPSGHRRFLVADVEALLARSADWSRP